MSSDTRPNFGRHHQSLQAPNAHASLLRVEQQTHATVLRVLHPTLMLAFQLTLFEHPNTNASLLRVEHHHHATVLRVLHPSLTTALPLTLFEPHLPALHLRMCP